MKKSNFIMIALVMLSIGIFSGCQSPNQIDRVKEMTLNQDKRMGLIQSLGGAHVSSQATHLLRMDDGKTLFLKSSVLDLGNTKYVGKETEVAGNILRTTDGNEVMDVMNIDIIDRDTSVAQDVPQWVDYGSDNLQVGLKYRDDYKLQENADGLTLTKTEKTAPSDSSTLVPAATTTGIAPTAEKKEATITIKVISRDVNYNLLEVMGVPSDSNADLLAKGYNKSKITQKALDAYKQAKSDGTEINYFIKSGFSYQLGFKAGDSATLVTDQNMFYDVLASINFGTNLGGSSGNTVTTNTTSTAALSGSVTTVSPASTTNAQLDGFESFTSEAMKFSIKYPKGYYFGNTASQTPSAVRSYAFSTKPADDKTGELVLLDIIKAAMPGGDNVDLGNGKKGVIIKSGGSVKIIVDWGNGQFFQLGGPVDLQPVMQQMASSITF